MKLLTLEDHPSGCKWLINVVIVSPLRTWGCGTPSIHGLFLGGDPNHLNHPRKEPIPGDEARFFAFATTVAAKAYGSDRECEGGIFFVLAQGSLNGTHFGDTNLW